MKRLMFVCKHNSRRSQMAEGFARHWSDNSIDIMSSGLESSQVDPRAIEVMREIGIDISHQTAKLLSAFDPEDYDAVVSLCGCGANLPAEWVVRDIFQDWQLEDPEGGSLETFRQARDEISQRVKALLEILNA